nr:hypothetical protein [uncultured Clostridium sp.]
MANDILFKEYTLTVDFEDRKSIDSRRKLQIKELYENCEIVKLGNFSIFKSFDRSGQFSSNGIILKDVDISILNKTANELEKIFSVKFEKKSNKISIESSYLIENKNNSFGVLQQTLVMRRYLKNNDLVISSLELFDIIDENLPIFIRFDVLNSGLQIKLSSQLENLQVLNETVEKYNEYVNSTLKNKLLTKGESENDSEEI